MCKMIINETKNTYEDMKFMVKKIKNTPVIILRRFIIVIAGLIMLSEGMNLVQKNMEYINYIAAGGKIESNGVLFIMLVILSFLLGILFIVFNFYYLNFSVYMGYKRTYSKWSPRHMEFTDEALEVSFEENGIKSNTSISYDAIDSYCRCNNALYIAIIMTEKKAKKYLCLHDDAYISGNVEELVNLLDKKIVKRS